MPVAEAAAGAPGVWADQDPHLARMLDQRLERVRQGDYHPLRIADVEQRLARLLAERGEHDARISKIRRLSGGASKEQFRFDCALKDGEAQPMVLRIDPVDGVLETSRQREFEVLEILQGVVPVPRPLWLDADGSVLGAPGMVTSFERGVTKPPSGEANVSGLGTVFTREWRDALGPQFLDILAAIHAIDVRKAGLRHFAIPDADPRQAARQRVNFWARLWREGCREPSPMFAVVEAWLRDNLPECPELVLVHGDYRTGNYLFDPETRQITAVLDWEIAHVGDFHEDLAWSWVEIFGARDANGTFLCANLMPEDEFVSGYEARTGRTVNRRTLRFYRVLLSWSVLAMASMGLGAAAAHHNHQDALLTWLSMVNPALIDEITRLLLDEVAA
jgi:aminoglycoside phosphotransferase (APT) family kinase protein